MSLSEINGFEQRETKLPTWAQNKMSRMRAAIVGLEDRVAWLSNQERYKASADQTDTVVEPHDHDGAIGLARGAMVQFSPVEDPRERESSGYRYRTSIRVRTIVDKSGVGWVEINGDSSLIVEMYASNTFRIRTRP